MYVSGRVVPACVSFLRLAGGEGLGESEKVVSGDVGGEAWASRGGGISEDRGESWEGVGKRWNEKR
jgi:hypothetical protein